MSSRSKPDVLLNMEEVWAFYRDDLLRVEDRINKTLASPVGLINELAHYIFNSGGKRIRPLLLVITAKLNGEAKCGEADILLATAVEFIHTATLLHDDVIDQADVRRGRKSAHTVWGNQASILVGDYLYTQAVTCALKMADQRVNMTLAEACLLMTQGETLQLMHHGNLDVTESEYLRIIQFKTAALLSATCRLGAIAGGLRPGQQETVAQFGIHLGIGYQLADDTLDYIANENLLGKSLGKDLREGKITLPLLHLLSKCAGREREKIRKMVQTGEVGDEALQEIRSMMKRHGSIEYSMKKAKEAIETAKKNLGMCPPSIHRQALNIVADYAVSRDH